MVQSGTLDASPITASGTACDTVSTVTSLTLDGQPASLSGTPPCLDFSAQLSSPWGLNIITGTARNQAGATAALVQSFLRSPQFSALTPAALASASVSTTTEAVPDGLYLQADQAVIDDGNRVDVNDLATLLDLYLATINLNTQLPTVLRVTPDTNGDGLVDSHVCNCTAPIPDITVHSTGYRVTRGTLSTGSWVVNYIRLINGDIALDVQAGATTLPISVAGYLDPTCTVACVTRVETSATVTGTLHATGIHVQATATATSNPDGTPRVEICPGCLTVTVDNPSLDINWGPLEFLDGPIGLSSMTTAIIQAFQGKIETAATAAFRPVLVNTLVSFLRSFEPPATVTLPPPMNTVLDVTSGFGVIAVEGAYPNGHARIGFDISVSPASPVLTGPLGSILRGGDVPVFSGSSLDYDLGIGIKDDLLNQFLWAAWGGGAFELPDLSVMGCSVPDGAAASMSATLPPVVMPGTNGHQIDIGIGDLYIEAGPPAAAATAASVAASADASLYASIRIGATITIDPDTDKLILTPAADPEIDVQIVHAAEGTDLTALAGQYRTMLACLMPKLLIAVVGAFPVPSPPIGALGLPGVPPDARWGLAGGVVARQDPYTTITGSVVVK